MKYYNRDNYERNLESYEVPEYFTKGARNEFVYGFIVGAVIGSAVGLVSISKSRATNKSIPKQDNQFKSSIIEQSELERQEADDKVNEIKSTIDDAQNKNTEVTDAELSAQRVAIQQETSDNNLAANVGEDIETIESLYEPYLLQHGFILLTPRGRMATDKAYNQLGIPNPKEE